MTPESQHIDYKSIRIIQKGESGFKDLAQAAVCFANAQGGKLVIGIEDVNKMPPSEQTINVEDINKTLTRIRSLSFNAGLTASDVLTHPNGG
jgi:ATP-dependent DNA helicase RecG